ncbi:MAG: hypothetical protein ABSE20_20860 [Acetobacteraceae bacterium]
MNRRPVGKQAVLRLISQQGEAPSEMAEQGTCYSAGGWGMTAALSACQPGLGRSPISTIVPTRRSWGQGRNMISGPAILMLVPVTDRQRLIAEYVDRDGAWPVSSSSQNVTLLEFLASRLPDPSHALSLCRMEVALTRASSGAEIFVEPEYRSVRERSKREVRTRIEHEAWGCIERAMQGRVVTESWDHIERTSWDSVEGAVWDGVERAARVRLECDAWQIVERTARNRIERGLYASLVWFHAEPGSVLRALHGATPPKVGKPAYPILFGPGVPNLCRAATPEEVVLWASLPTDDTAPDLVERLLAEGIVGYTD